LKLKNKKLLNILKKNIIARKLQYETKIIFNNLDFTLKIILQEKIM